MRPSHTGFVPPQVTHPALCIGCIFYTFICLCIAVSLAAILGEGISEDYGDDHLVTSEPSYDEAARLAGYLDSDGVYQGGLAQWDDWSEDSYSCESVSGNGKYCQRWSTERYYADPEEQFLKGNCTCVRPLANTVDSTFDVSINDWYSGTDDGETTSSSEAALEDASFCSAWNCREKRYTQECTCIEYETQTTCSRRQLRRSSGGSSGTSCSSREVCVAIDCVYIETNFYTACDCDAFGLRREEWGPDWWREYTHCDEFRCHHGTNLVTMNESFALASSATETSLPPENISSVPINPSIVSEVLDYGWLIDYQCTQTQEANNSAWCSEWSGMTRHEESDVVEQMCECQTGEPSDTFCTEWHCTSYYMDRCQECFAGMGILLGGAIMVCMAPLFAAGCRGHYCLVTCSAPVALAASGLLAAFFGGWYAVWSGLVPGTVIAVILGGCIAKVMPRRVAPETAIEVKGGQQQPTVMVYQGSATTPPQTPMPVVGMGLPGNSAQVYNHTAVAAGAAQQPGFSSGGVGGAHSYTPPGGAQQPYQYAAAPSIPVGSNPPPYAAAPSSPVGSNPSPYAGGGGQGAYGGTYAGGAYTSSTYGYQSPPQFVTGVNGGNAR